MERRKVYLLDCGQLSFGQGYLQIAQLKIKGINNRIKITIEDGPEIKFRKIILERKDVLCLMLLAALNVWPGTQCSMTYNTKLFSGLICYSGAILQVLQQNVAKNNIFVT